MFGGAVFAVGCTNGAATLASAPVQQTAPSLRYRVAVSVFDDRVFHRDDIGRGMADMLAEALVKTGRFTVLERPAVDGGQKPEAAAPGRAEGAQWLIRGTITAFDPSCTGNPLVLTSPGQGCVSLDIGVVDAASGRLVDTASVDGTSTGDSPDLSFATGGLPAGLGDFGGTPAEQAIRTCIEAAARHIAAAAH